MIGAAEPEGPTDLSGLISPTGAPAARSPTLEWENSLRSAARRHSIHWLSGTTIDFDFCTMFTDAMPCRRLLGNVAACLSSRHRALRRRGILIVGEGLIVRFRWLPPKTVRRPHPRPDTERCSRSYCARARAGPPAGCPSLCRSGKPSCGEASGCRTLLAAGQWRLPTRQRALHTGACSDAQPDLARLGKALSSMVPPRRSSQASRLVRASAVISN